METKISKTQIEVWEWKEALHKELENVTEGERLNYIHEKVKTTVERLKKAKRKVDVVASISYCCLIGCWTRERLAFHSHADK